MLYENMKPKWHSSFNAPPSPLQGPVQLYHPCVSSTLAGHKLVLRKLKNGNNMPLTCFMGQAGGLFIVEFFWQRPGNAGGTSDMKNDWHVIAGSCAPSLSHSLSHTHTHTPHPSLDPRSALAWDRLVISSPLCLYTVNCCARIIECNTLGKIPFSDKFQKESAETHARVAARFTIRQMGDAWVVASLQI